MSNLLVPEIPAPGFSFDNCQRDEVLKQNGYTVPSFTKTGTTIAGVVFKGGVVLGADTRSSQDTVITKVITNKKSEKIHYLADNIYCCGAGTAADTRMATRTISAQVQMLGLHTGRVVPVASSAVLLKRLLYRYRGNICAALIVGGVDSTGPHVHSIEPHGSSDELCYATLGSGMCTAMGIFEARWKKDMGEEAAKTLVRDAILGGIFNDLGSGSNVDLCVIRKDGTEYIRNFEMPNVKGEKQCHYKYPKGTTSVLREREIPLEVQFECTRRVVRGQPIVEHNRQDKPSSSRGRSSERCYSYYS